MANFQIITQIIQNVSVTPGSVPENSKGEKLTSRSLKSECTFKAAYVVSAKEKTINGKKVKYQEKIPISSYAAATHVDTPAGGGE